MTRKRKPYISRSIHVSEVVRELARDMGIPFPPPEAEPTTGLEAWFDHGERNDRLAGGKIPTDEAA